MICLICGKSLKNKRALVQHVRNSHKLTTKQYYDSYLKKEDEGLCIICKKETDYRSFRYLETCSCECRTKNMKIKEHYSTINKGRKQSQEIIDNRVKKTDQKKKEATKQETLMKRYGVTNSYQIESVVVKKLLAVEGVKRPRSAETQTKIIDSKRRNGTLKHTSKGKINISNALKILYRDENYDKTKFLSKNNTYVHGYYNDMYYRSSYELTFLRFCTEYSIVVESAENNKYAVNYIDDEGVKRKYFPDFYLPDYDLIVEIKPLSMYDLNINKFDAAMRVHKYVVVTEEELYKGEELYEYICSA